jgi:hypothetical protein
VLLFLLMRVTYCNVYWARFARVPPSAVDLRLLRLDQQWNMFAPRPLPDDGYFVVVGETQAGDWVNGWIRGDSQVTWEKPARGASFYPNARWRKLMMNIFLPENQVWREPVLTYLGGRWNELHPDRRLRSMRLYFVLEKSLPDGTESPLAVVQLAYVSRSRVNDSEALSTFSTLGSGLSVLRSLGEVQNTQTLPGK